MFSSRRQSGMVAVLCVAVFLALGAAVRFAPFGGDLETVVGVIDVALVVLFVMAAIQWLMYLNRDINRRDS